MSLAVFQTRVRHFAGGTPIVLAITTGAFARVTDGGLEWLQCDWLPGIGRRPVGWPATVVRAVRESVNTPPPLRRGVHRRTLLSSLTTGGAVALAGCGARLASVEARMRGHVDTPRELRVTNETEEPYTLSVTVANAREETVFATTTRIPPDTRGEVALDDDPARQIRRDRGDRVGPLRSRGHARLRRLFHDHDSIRSGDPPHRTGPRRPRRCGLQSLAVGHARRTHALRSPCTPLTAPGARIGPGRYPSRTDSTPISTPISDPWKPLSDYLLSDRQYST